MKRSLIVKIALCVCFSSTAFANEKIPPLDVLSSVVGLEASSKQFTNVLTKYDFSENHKRKNSWGSSFGVFFELRQDKVQVGIRPPSDATNMPTYAGKLPEGLVAGDSVDDILKKLGKPKKTNHDSKGYYEMIYDGMTVYTMGGTLFEVWLIPEENKKQNQRVDPTVKTPVE